MSWSTSKLRVRLARRKTGLSPPVNYFTDRSKAVLLLWIFYVFRSCVCYAFVCLFICALGSPAGKGMTSWLPFVVSNCEFVTFPLVSCAGVVLDCIDSWSLHPYLLIIFIDHILQNLTLKILNFYFYFMVYRNTFSKKVKQIGGWGVTSLFIFQEGRI